MSALVRGRPQSAAEEVANGVVHALALAGAASVAPLVVLQAWRRGDPWQVAGAATFAATLVLMYLASTVYHFHPVRSPAQVERKRRLRTLDHAAIYLLIAGSYTPFLLGALRGAWGWSLLAAEWGLAAVGIAAKLRWGFRWPRLSTAMYIAMGWLALVALGPLVERVSPAGVAWLVASGVCYTAGVAFYATDWRVRYGHAVWHLFVAGGSACHAWAVLRFAGGG